MDVLKGCYSANHRQSGRDVLHTVRWVSLELQGKSFIHSLNHPITTYSAVNVCQENHYIIELIWDAPHGSQVIAVYLKTV